MEIVLASTLTHCLASSLCLSLCCCGFVTCRINLSAFSHYDYECVSVSVGVSSSTRSQSAFRAQPLGSNMNKLTTWHGAWCSALNARCSVLCCCPKLNRLVDGPTTRLPVWLPAFYPKILHI